MDHIRAPTASGGLAGRPSQASRFEELLQQLRQEHSRILKQVLEEVAGASAPARVGPWLDVPAGPGVSGRFGRDEMDVDALSDPPPPLPLPRVISPEGVCSSLRVACDLEIRSEHSSAPKEAESEEPARDNDHQLVSSSSMRSMDADNSVKHVRRMMTRAGSLDSLKVEESASVPSFGFLVSRMNRFFKKSETEEELFSAAVEDNGFKKAVTSATFVFVFATLILLNTVVLVFQAQYEGMQSGYESELGRMETPASEVWPGASQAFDILDVGFGILFTAELATRVCALRRAFFWDAWNALDFTIVLSWLIERTFKTFLPVDTNLIRVARLARLLRFLRMAKALQAFDSLYLIIASVKSSFSALAWSSVVLVLGEVMLALLLNVLLEDYWSDPRNAVEDREEVYGYFGTFTKSIQTMIEMLLGNWYTITRVLTSKVSEWYMLLGITHQLVVGFAVIEVITGVFLHETFKVASLDDTILVNETQREMTDQSSKMLRFFKYADMDASGELDRAEFRRILARDKVQEWMTAQGLDVHNIERVFTLLDQDRNGLISPEELIAGALNLKGQAKAMELAVVRAMVEDIHRALRLKTKPRTELYGGQVSAADHDGSGGRTSSVAWSSSRGFGGDIAGLPGSIDSQ